MIFTNKSDLPEHAYKKCVRAFGAARTRQAIPNVLAMAS
jgi:hypothetical protein